MVTFVVDTVLPEAEVTAEFTTLALRDDLVDVIEEVRVIFSFRATLIPLEYLPPRTTSLLYGDVYSLP